MNNNSVFIENPEIKKRTYVENDLAFAFLTNIPITPGHTLIAPKRVVTTIEELTIEEMGAIHELLLIVRRRLKEVLESEGYNYAWNEGRDFGQSVAHFHLHVVPRKINDSGISEYEPRRFLYRPGSRENTPENELASIARSLRLK